MNISEEEKSVMAAIDGVDEKHSALLKMRGIAERAGLAEEAATLDRAFTILDFGAEVSDKDLAVIDQLLDAYESAVNAAHDEGAVFEEALVNELKSMNLKREMITDVYLGASLQKEEKAVMAAIDGKEVTAQEGGYQGWKNYESWAVALWFDNEQSSQQMVQEWAQEAFAAAPGDDSVSKGYLTVMEMTKIGLADRIKSYVEENNPLADESTMYSDLLGAAISEVDWQEVAEHYMEDLEEPGNTDEVPSSDTEQASVESLIDGNDVK